MNNYNITAIPVNNPTPKPSKTADHAAQTSTITRKMIVSVSIVASQSVTLVWNIAKDAVYQAVGHVSTNLTKDGSAIQSVMIIILVK